MANELKTINLPGIGRYEISGSGGASSFSELTDTDFTNLQNGQVPVYNSTTEKWENGDVDSDLPTGGTQGQVLTKASATDYDVNWTTPSSGGIGKDLTGQSVKPTSSSTVTAGTNAEIFNDYRDRTFNPLSLKASAGNVSSGNYSHSEGKRTTASGENSHAEGDGSTASGESSHAEGFSTASGDYSHAEGESTASNYYAHAEGMSTTASGMRSHAEGESTTASGTRSHAEGYNTTARYEFQHVQGKYNNNKSTTLFEIGNGTADNARSNAFEVYQDGSLSQDNGSTKFKFTQVNGSDGYYDASDNFHEFGGSSIPTGGTQGQVLTKNSSTDGDASWADPADGGVGKDLTGQTVEPEQGTTVTAGTNAEIFNDYRERQFNETTGNVTQGNVASGIYSHAEGQCTTASGRCSHAEGGYTVAKGGYSHVQGFKVSSDAFASLVSGSNFAVNNGGYGSGFFHGMGWSGESYRPQKFDTLPEHGIMAMGINFDGLSSDGYTVNGGAGKFGYGSAGIRKNGTITFNLDIQALYLVMGNVYDTTGAYIGSCLYMVISGGISANTPNVILVKSDGTPPTIEGLANNKLVFKNPPNSMNNYSGQFSCFRMI